MTINQQTKQADRLSMLSFAAAMYLGSCSYHDCGQLHTITARNNKPTTAHHEVDSGEVVDEQIPGDPTDASAEVCSHPPVIQP